MKSPKRFWKEDSGQSIPEYGLILALVSIGLVLVLVACRDELGSIFQQADGTLGSSGTPKQADPI